MLPRTPQNRTRKSPPAVVPPFTAATLARTRAACTMILPHGTVAVRLYPALFEARAGDDPAAGGRVDADLFLDAGPAEGHHQRGNPGQALSRGRFHGRVPEGSPDAAGRPRRRIAAPVRRLRAAPAALPGCADLRVPDADHRQRRAEV